MSNLRTRVDIRLPAELVIYTLRILWISPLPVKERVQIVIILPLVSFTFRQLFEAIYYADLHIFSVRHFKHLVTTWERPIINNRGQPVARHLLCKSLSFDLFSDDLLPASRRHPMYYPGDTCHARLRQLHPIPRRDPYETLGAAFYWLTPGELPNLRKVIITHTNLDYEDLIRQFNFIPLSAQVTTLELRYTFTSNTPGFVLEALRRKEVYRSQYWHKLNLLGKHLQGLRKLIIRNAGPGFVRSMASYCPNITEVTTDDPNFTLTFSRPVLSAIRMGGSEGSSENIHATFPVVDPFDLMAENIGNGMVASNLSLPPPEPNLTWSVDQTATHISNSPRVTLHSRRISTKFSSLASRTRSRLSRERVQRA